MSKFTLVKLYYSFAFPYLKYGINAWGNSRKTLLQKVHVAQNKILRIINFKCLKDCVKMSTSYKDMKILQVNIFLKLSGLSLCIQFIMAICHVYLTATTNLWQLNVITIQDPLLIKIIICKECTRSLDNLL